MANIIDKTTQIRQATHGLEVRESLASGIEVINAEVEKNSNRQTEVETRQSNLENTFNAEMENAISQNPASAETVAARTDNVNGKTYENLPLRLDNIASSLADKTQQISNLDTNKAEKTEVTALDLKKADQAFVDSQFAAIVSGAPKGTYSTLEALKAAYPTGVEGVFLVLANGHWYYWNNTISDWADGGVYQSTGLDFIPSKLEYVENLFNPQTRTANKYVDIATGNLLDSTISYSSDYIEVLPYKNYIVNYKTNCSIAYYDESKSFIRGEIVSNLDFVVTPTNCKYIRLSQRSTNISAEKFVLQRGKTLKYKINDVVPDGEVLTTTVSYDFKNLFNNSIKIDLKKLDYQTGEIIDNEYSFVSDYISIKQSTNYILNYECIVCFYDVNKIFISGLSFIKNFKTPSNATYVRISKYNNDGESVQLEEGLLQTEKIDYGVFQYKLDLQRVPNLKFPIDPYYPLNYMGYINVNRFPRLAGEIDDSPRIQRAIDSAYCEVVFIPSGVYEIATPLIINNHASIEMHKSAKLKAVAPMDFVLIYDGGNQFNSLIVTERDRVFDDQTLFIRGGDIDGNGLASCLNIKNYKHYTLKDISLHNGKIYGLRVGGSGAHGYELIATNVYCKCTMEGLAGNVGISSIEGDSHYTDCIVVDYTVGFEMLPGSGSNRLTRCHTWGGIIPEMLNNSVNFRCSAGDTVLRDCYADTGKIGFEINADTRILGSAYFNNYSRFGLDDIVVIKQTAGTLLVSDCRFNKTSPNAVLYQSTGGSVIWRDNILLGGLVLPS